VSTLLRIAAHCIPPSTWTDAACVVSTLLRIAAQTCKRLIVVPPSWQSTGHTHRESFSGGLLEKFLSRVCIHPCWGRILPQLAVTPDILKHLHSQAHARCMCQYSALSAFNYGHTKSVTGESSNLELRTVETTAELWRHKISLDSLYKSNKRTNVWQVL